MEFLFTFLRNHRLTRNKDFQSSTYKGSNLDQSSNQDHQNSHCSILRSIVGAFLSRRLETISGETL